MNQPPRRSRLLVPDDCACHATWWLYMEPEESRGSTPGEPLELVACCTSEAAAHAAKRLLEMP